MSLVVGECGDTDGDGNCHLCIRGFSVCPKVAAAEASRLEIRRLERIRVFAREMARMSSDLTTLTFTVPISEVALQQHMQAMRESLESVRMAAL